jgi:hypothetical protein
MKTIICILISLNTFAQKGVFLTYNDYLNNHLSYTEDKMKLNDFFDLSYITVVKEDQKIKLFKDSIYGVSKDNGLVRFQNGEQYFLAEKGKVWVFYKWINVREGKGSRTEKSYYFSVSGEEKLIVLSVNNLKNAFPQKDKFQEMVDAQFQTASVADYDTLHQKFKVNYLLERSEQ